MFKGLVSLILTSSYIECITRTQKAGYFTNMFNGYQACICGWHRIGCSTGHERRHYLQEALRWR